MRNVIKNYKFSIILLSGVIIGALLGIFWGPKATVLQPFADIFLNLVFCLIVPIVFVSISGAIASMTNIGKLKKLLSIFLVVVLVSGLITCILALITVFIFDPSRGAKIDLGVSTDNIKASLNLVNMITVSDFVDLLSIKNMLPLIIFSIFFGIAVSAIGEKGKPIIALLTSLTEALSKLVSFVMYLAPVGIACYFAALIGNMGSQIVSSVARVSIIYVIFCIVFFIIFSNLFSYWGGGKEGVRRFWKHIWLPLTTAMGTCSSTACIPVNMLACKKMGIPEEISDIIIPLGGSVHKNGVVSVQIIKIAFLLGIFGMPLGTEEILKAILVSIISGVIVGTIPSGGFIGEMFICTAFGFPLEAVPIIVIMGTLTDPFCTMVNVTGDPAICMLLAKLSDGKDWISSKIGTSNPDKFTEREANM